MAQTCSTCSRKLAAGTKHGQCRSCRYPRRGIRRCSCCRVKIDHANQSGICRTCRCRLNHVGAVNERRLAALRASAKDPILRARLQAKLVAYANSDAGRLQRSLAGRTKKQPAPAPFERAMECVRNGAGITIVRPIPRAEPQFTLGGVSSI